MCQEIEVIGINLEQSNIVRYWQYSKEEINVSNLDI